MARKSISIVLPCHNEEKNLPTLVSEIINNIPSKYNFEIILVDDGSTDNTELVIHKLSKKNKKIKGVIFHRNFGHQMALIAGIEKSLGKCVITMDADFQHPPKYIPAMLELWEKGQDLIQMKKNNRQGVNRLTHFVRALSYRLWYWVSDGTISPSVSDFRLMDEKIVEYLKESKEKHIFLRGVTTLASKQPYYLKYVVAKRKYGKSSYTFSMFANMFVNGLISFSTKPLRLASVTGLLLFATLTVIAVFEVIEALINKRPITEGWLSNTFFTLGVNSILMIYLGILGEYVAVIFNEVKARPRYLIKDQLNLKSRLKVKK